MTLVSITEDILSIIYDFLSKKDKHAIVLTSRLIWQELRNHQYYELTPTSSLQYYNDISFRNMVSSRILYPNRQLSVTLSYDMDITDVSFLANVHSLDISYCSDIENVSVLADVPCLHLCGCCHDISELRNHTLDLADSEELGNCDIKGLGGVYDLCLAYCPFISDVSMLGRIHTLNLAGCRSLSDVSALGNVYYLDLSYCQKITDVSALGRVHSLYLRKCQGITDVSALGTVHTLNLSECHNITNVSALKNVYSLSLYACQQFLDISALGRLYALDIRYCRITVNLPPTHSVKQLKQQGTKYIEYI